MKKEKEVSKRKRYIADEPYEKFQRFGPGSLTESELLAIILQTGTRDKSAKQLAEEVLSLARYPREGLLGLYDVSLEELMELKGIGPVKAIKLKCLAELSMRINQASAREGLVFLDSGTVADYFMEQLRHRDTECLVLVSLDSKCRLIAEKELSNGSVRMSLISPREIFMEALYARAVNILLVHNHPSGDPSPSRLDRELTETVEQLGIELKIPLLDHIIIGDRRYISFREQGYLR